jgi:hypothetical protein
MNRTASIFLGLSLAASALLSLGAGCGNSTSTTTGTGGTGTGGSTSSTTSATTGTGGSPAATLDCASYCGEIMANCTAANAQFTDMATCMGTCAAYPAGTIADKSGDTLGCRIYHAGAPAKMDPAMHCSHAGITGGDKDPNGTTGVCGEPCDAFCALAIPTCKNQPGAYADAAACMTECKAFKVDTATYSTADTGTDDMGCRMYHLTAATKDAAAATLHCGHIHAVSPVCTM